MKIIKKIIFLCLIKFGYTIDWCGLTCFNNEPNIVCVQKEKCETNWPCENVSLNHEVIIDQHNELRNKFAVGEEKASGGIKVANMMALVWDNDLAYTAKCNMAGCGDLKEDLCHRTPKFPIVGQNQWSSVTGRDLNCAEKAIDGIQSWYDEILHLTSNELKEDSESYQANKKTKHFTQIIWAQTTHVGCAMTKKVDDMGLITCMMTCNYAPGSMKRSRVFHQGIPCSECPDPFCTQNGGLCWVPEKSERHNVGTFISPNVILLVIFIYFFTFISFIK